MVKIAICKMDIQMDGKGGNDMNITSINNATNYTALLRSLSSGTQNKETVSLESMLLQSSTTINGFDTLSISPEALKRLAGGGSAGGGMRMPRGSGERMEGAPDVFVTQQERDEMRRQEKAAQSAQIEKERYADDGWRHHDNGMTRYEFHQAFNAMTATSDSLYKHYDGAQSMGESEWQLMDSLSAILQHEGITLEDGETFTVTTQKKADGSYGYVFSGMEDESKLQKIQFALSEAHVIDGKIMAFNKNQFGSNHLLNSDWVQEGDMFTDMQDRANAVRTKDSIERGAVNFTEFDWSKLKKNEDGTYEGYPERFEWLFTGNYDKNPPASNIGAVNLVQIANNILPTVDLMLKYGYDNIPDYDKGTVNVTISNKGAQYSY